MNNNTKYDPIIGKRGTAAESFLTNKDAMEASNAEWIAHLLQQSIELGSFALFLKRFPGEDRRKKDPIGEYQRWLLDTAILPKLSDDDQDRVKEYARELYKNEDPAKKYLPNILDNYNAHVSTKESEEQAEKSGS